MKMFSAVRRSSQAASQASAGVLHSGHATGRRLRHTSPSLEASALALVAALGVGDAGILPTQRDRCWFYLYE